MNELLKGPRELVKDLPHARSDSFVSTYANNTGLVATFYDVTLIFGKVAVDPAATGVIEDHAAISMSWEHAKALVNGIRKAIEKYEEEHNVRVRDLQA